MFICPMCNCDVGPGERAYPLVTQVREKEYPPRMYVNRPREDNPSAEHDPGGHGQEIVKELRVCSDCFTEHGGASDYNS